MAGALLHKQRVEVLALCSMLDSDVEIVRLELEAGLKETHFYTEVTQNAFRRIKHLRRQNRSPTWETVLADLSIADGDRKRLTAISAQMRPITKQAEAKEAILTLDLLRQVRGVYDIGKRISEKFSENETIDVSEEIQAVAKGLESVQRGIEGSLHDDKTADAQVINILKDLRKGVKDRVIPTGMAEFDKENGGVLRGTNFTVGAPSGEGKSHLALCLALNMARQGYRVCFLSMEMPYNMVWSRIMTYLTGVSYNALNMKQISDKQYDWVEDTYRVFQESLRRRGACFRVIAEQTFTMSDFLASVSPYNYDVIVIDYLSLMEGMRNQDYWMRIGEAAADAQTYAIRTGSVVITVCQTDDEGKARLSQQIKDNAGLMWTWTGGDKRGKGNEKQDKSDFDKKGIDFIDVEMPKGRTYKRFTLRLYRSTGHSQLTCDPRDLQKPWIHKFDQAADIYKQRPWENGLEESEAEQHKINQQRRKRVDGYKSRLRSIDRRKLKPRPAPHETLERLYSKWIGTRPSAFARAGNDDRVKYYHDDDPSPPSYSRNERRSR